MKPIYSTIKSHATTLLLVLVISLFFIIPVTHVNANTDTPIDPTNTDEQLDTISGNEDLENDNVPPEGFQIIEEGQIETFTMNMPQLDNREKEIIVYLPANYSTSDIDYPVIYLQNAEDIFIYNEYKYDYWLLNESLYHFYTSELGDDVIIVGVKSDPIYHWNEYSPWVNDNMYSWMDHHDANRVEGGDGEAYLDFLINTLKPEIDDRYRTLPERENTAIGGLRMGGLISLYAGITRADIYSQVMAMSPAVWFAESGGFWLSNNRLLELINQVGAPQDVTFVLDIDPADKTTDIEIRPAVYDHNGDKISFPQAYLEGAQILIATLVNNGLPESHISHENINIDPWTNEFMDATRDDPKIDFSYYFPSFRMTQKVGYFTVSMTGYLDRTRRVWVYLPPDYYRNTDKRYPVLYLTNAQNLFGSEVGVNLPDWEDWKFDETLDWFYEKTGKGIIAVALEFDAHYPWDEYSNWDNNYMGFWLDDDDGDDENFTGKADSYLNFIVNELKPNYIDANYRTLSDRNNTGIGGGSRHALFALYAGLTKPEVFSRVMAFSPAVWLANNSTNFWETNNGLRNWFSSNNAPTNIRYYLYVGTEEDSAAGANYEEGVNKVKTELENDGATVRRDLNSGVYPPYHWPSTWSHWVDDALDWLGYY